MKLSIRKLPVNVVFLTSPIKDWLDAYESMVDRPSVTIGDLAYFNKSDYQSLLIFLEANPQVDCYSSQDIKSSILISRFTCVEKDPLPPPVSSEDPLLKFLQDYYNNQIFDKHLFLTSNTPIRSKQDNYG